MIDFADAKLIEQRKMPEGRVQKRVVYCAYCEQCRWMCHSKTEKDATDQLIVHNRIRHTESYVDAKQDIS